MIANVVLSHTNPESWRAQAEVFYEIFFVFLVIGTLVGVVVVAYTLHHVYKYRDRGEDPEGFEKPRVGELPRGQEGGKSRKLFVSFALSAILVISVVVYSYGLLLYVEAGPTEEIAADANAENMEIHVTGIQFGWQFEYADESVAEEDRVNTFNTLRVPQGEDRVIRLEVTSEDVWHTFGVTELRLKADSIPGQWDSTWFIPSEVGTYQIECFELCGTGHSQMVGEIEVMEEAEFNEWYQDQLPDEDEGETDEGNDEANGDDAEETGGDETDGDDEAEGNGDANGTGDGGDGEGEN